MVKNLQDNRNDQKEYSMWTKKKKKTRQTSYLWMLYGCCSAGCVLTFLLFSGETLQEFVYCDMKKKHLKFIHIWSNKIEGVLKIMLDLFHRTYLNVEKRYWTETFQARGKLCFTSSLNRRHKIYTIIKIPPHYPLIFFKFITHFFRWTTWDISKKTCWSFSKLIHMYCGHAKYIIKQSVCWPLKYTEDWK